MHAATVLVRASFVSTLKDLGVPGLLGGVLGVVLGSRLNRRAAFEALVLQQGRDAAGQLLDALVESRIAISVMVEKDQLAAGVATARPEWRRASLRYAGRINNAELTSRVDAISLVPVLAGAGGRPRTPNPGTEAPPAQLFDLAYIIDRAFLDAFCALDAFLNGQDLPPRSFPGDAMEVMVDESREGNAIARLRAELNNLPQPAETARTKIITM